MTTINDLLPPAENFAMRLAEAEAEKARQAMQQKHAAEAEHKALLEAIQRPSGVSEEEGLRRGLRIIERAVANGMTEVQFYRFPNMLCTDHGRAINQGEANWPETLTGVPKEIYDLWHKYFRDKGYRLKVEIVDFPDGIPGDVGMSLKWA